MASLSRAFDGVGVEHGLNTVEGCLIDDCRMRALVLDTAPGDVPEVVAVAKDMVELVGTDRSFDLLGGLPIGEPSLIQRVGQAAQAPFAGGVAGERPADQVGALLVDLDRTDLDPVDVLADATRWAGWTDEWTG